MIDSNLSKEMNEDLEKTNIYGGWIHFYNGGRVVCLDGDYDINILEKIIYAMNYIKNHKNEN